MLELKDRDALGRITKWEISKKYEIKLPNIAIVINPNRLIVSPSELKRKFKAEIIITNSFIIKNNKRLRELFLEKGLHKVLNWKGPIYTDSGVFQMYSHGIKDIDQDEILNFQKSIGSDIVTPVDVFTFPEDNKKTAKEKLKKTIERIKDARKKVEFLSGPIQGGMFLDLRERACKKVSKIKPDVFSIGGIVPLMENYRFDKLFDIILRCKQNLPFNIPIHAFGVGHPMIFSILVAFGVDLFDSAMYSLAAKRGGYLTSCGTLNIIDIEEFPCNCPICTRYNPGEVRQAEDKERLLSLHNLYITFSEIRSIRNAIKGDYLWELVQQRARSHPNLLHGFVQAMKKYSKWMIKYDLFSKKSALKWLGEETIYRPEILRAKKLIKNVKSERYFFKKPFGKIPIGLSGTYPFGQSVIPGYEKKVKVGYKTMVKQILDYQFGSDSHKDIGNFDIEVSKVTGRIRRVWKGKKLLGTVRSYDGLFLPTIEGAKLLKKIKKVYIKSHEISEIVKRGGSIFSRFINPQENIIPGEEVAICDCDGNIVGVGRALLSSDEIVQMERGVAIKIRTRINNSKF